MVFRASFTCVMVISSVQPPSQVALRFRPFTFKKKEKKRKKYDGLFDNDKLKNDPYTELW